VPQVLENDFGPEKSWKFTIKVLEIPGICWDADAMNIVYLMFSSVSKRWMEFDGNEENVVEVILWIDEVIFVIALWTGKISKMSYYVSDGTWKTYLLSHWILSHPVFIRCLLCLVPSVSCLVSLTGIYCTTHLFIHFRQCSQQTECSSMNSRDWEVYNYSFHSRGAYLSPWLTVTIWFASGCHLRNNSHENCLLWAPGL